MGAASMALGKPERPLSVGVGVLVTKILPVKFPNQVSAHQLRI